MFHDQTNFFFKQNFGTLWKKFRKKLDKYVFSLQNVFFSQKNIVLWNQEIKKIKMNNHMLWIKFYLIALLSFHQLDLLDVPIN
jgi:hypothetical protein